MARPAPRPGDLAAAAAAALLAFACLWRLAGLPPMWEEPRRCLVAREMAHRGDYVVPRLLGEPYLNKPPLQAWLIAALARFDPGAVRVAHPRAIGVAAGALPAGAEPTARAGRWALLPPAPGAERHFPAPPDAADSNP